MNPFTISALIVFDLLFAGCTLIALIVPAGKRLVPYFWRSLITSNLGIAMSNSVFWAFIFREQGLLKPIIEGEPSQGLFGVLLTIGLLASPFYVSVLGAVIGIAVGVFWARQNLTRNERA